MERIIIVSNRLPVTISLSEKEIKFSPSTGGLATGLNSSFKDADKIWIGWPGFLSEKKNAKSIEFITKQLAAQQMSPVYLTRKDVDLFYEGFSNSTLWPLFHYFPRYTSFVEEQWEAYKRVNQLFCDEVLKQATEDSLIWIHDYHLFLLPQLIREKLPKARIGFFQHIPFPAYDIFRILPSRQEMLKGVMGADLIGFHTYEDVKHFLTSVNRILGSDNRMGEVRYEDRVVYADAFPMGINYEQMEEASKSKTTELELEEYCKQCGNVKIILSIDRLDYSKGMPERLKAFEVFLENNPEYREKVSLMMIVAPSREKVAMYKKLKTEIDELVGQINSKFRTITWSPILYFYRSFPFDSLPALYKIADIALITPLRDGMNLVCKEYVASRTDQTGVLILSEMAGAAKELHEALIINPYNVNETAEAIKTALLIPLPEQKRRMKEMQQSLRKYNVKNWVDLYISKLQETYQKRETLSMKVMSPTIHDKILRDFSTSERRKLFLDYDGTLTSLRERPEYAKPDKELIHILNDIAKDPNTKLVITTGRDKNNMEQWFGDISNIDIIAEHGLWIKRRGEAWRLGAFVSDEWKEKVKPLMEIFVNRTPGSFIEEKDYSLAWHYRLADPDLAETRGRELVDLLQYLTSNLKLNVIEGKKVVEIKSAEINKGSAVLDWITDEDDFILAAGDDWTDEDMFRVMPERAYTIKMGYSASLAKYNLLANQSDDPSEEMRNFLKELSKCKIKETVK